ncbi:MAG: D-hexose-6-phosphate mutarotase [Lautropia sp.]|nr:D-hexose-6-phosphate mutarotase [Lautropia sp.]
MAGSVELVTVAGQPGYCLRHACGDRVLVLQQGGQVLSWMTADGVERMYLSPELPAARQPARGGVPVIFPQFNQRGPDFQLPRHGFARNLAWVLVPSSAQGQARSAGAHPSSGVSVTGGATERDKPAQAGIASDPVPVMSRGSAIDTADMTLCLSDSDATRKYWAFAFRLDLHISLAPNRLTLTMQVQNHSAEPMSFTAALHTYLTVPELLAAELHGLAGVRRLDTIRDEPGTGPGGALRFTGPIDDIYFDLPRPLRLDSALGRLQIEVLGGFADTVVWNPGPDGAAELADMPDEDWRRMLCVEAAVIGRPAQLPAGGVWSGTQRFSLL